jgi:hypothetical protein
MTETEKTATPDPWDVWPEGITPGIERLNDHLPPGHIGRLETDPVVAFLHFHDVRADRDGETTFDIRPLVPNHQPEGFSENLPDGALVTGTTPAQPGSRMISLAVRGPQSRHRITIGYEYPGQTHIDWHAVAIEAAD